MADEEHGGPADDDSGKKAPGGRCAPEGAGGLNLVVVHQADGREVHQKGNGHAGIDELRIKHSPAPVGGARVWAEFGAVLGHEVKCKGWGMGVQ